MSQVSFRAMAVVVGCALSVGTARTAVGQTRCDRPGPDVIVGELNGVASWGTVGDISGFSVGTTSCNVGNQELFWIADEPLHPVIGQNMFRLKNGRFEQIGMSWLKHGFLALALNTCNCGCINPGTGARLGVGCSDPYSASLNGQQGSFGTGGLGPRFEVNAHTGTYNFPYAFQGLTGNAVFKRIQVHNSDLDPALNVGAMYFVDAQYVTPDDSAAGNQNNNASYQRVLVNPIGGSFSITLTDSTQREKPGIQAWPDHDPAAVLRIHDDPEGGRFMLAYKCSPNADNTVHYEYALYNMNSQRSAGRFSIPIPVGANITNIGFHDVDYHSGEPFDGTDWSATIAAGEITWSTETFAVNPNANAVRWGTIYNFRFDSDGEPVDGTGTIGYFNPGAGGDEGTVAVCVPSLGIVDCVGTDGPLEAPIDSQALNPKNRYLTVLPLNPGVQTALRVTLVASEQFPDSVGRQWWVGPPAVFCENGREINPPCDVVGGIPKSTFTSAGLQCGQHCQDWGNLGDLLYIGDINIVPGAEYEIQSIACGCDVGNQSNFSVPLPIATSGYGDTLLTCQGCPCGNPDGQVNIVDCVGGLLRFVNADCAPLKTRVDLEPADPDRQINITDVLRCAEAFQGVPYPFTAPAPCGP